MDTNEHQFTKEFRFLTEDNEENKGYVLGSDPKF